VNPLTFEEHRELAQEIIRARTRLLELSNVLSTVYGPESEAALAFQTMTEALERVCLEMQAQAELDCPGLNASSFYR
jgi:hypothetical protein